ncbi:MAG: hypothetical protein DHS20C09_19260 [marine bacterium B5-7]|nr:MAG: hypothetical protein DHS20C09_19260 [marine bacterium B5-7]
MKFRTTVYLFLFALLAQNTYAIQVSGLYQATVPVADESVSKRNPAIKQALIQVLIKLTGDRNIRNSSDIVPLIERPERFVQQFRYRQIENLEEPTSQSTELLVQFDETALNEGLRSYGLTVWGQERPSTLVWLAYEQNEIRRLVSFEERPEYLNTLDAGAASRGLSLLFPLLDLEDSSRISISDVWGSFKDPISNASNRYQADVILTAKVIQVLPNLWESKWTAYINDLTESWTSQGELAEIVLKEGIDELADRIASQYANIGSSVSEVIELLVTDVDDLDKYARALSYLESVQSISSVQVKRVSKNDVMFTLVNRGGLAAIDQSIALGKTLELVSNNDQLTYRLLPR